MRLSCCTGLSASALVHLTALARLTLLKVDECDVTFCVSDSCDHQLWLESEVCGSKCSKAIFVNLLRVMPYMKWLPSTQPAVPCDGLQQQ
jgi:hypothetical protein